MSRIEDNEAERVERARQEAEAAAKQNNTKRADAQRQFGAYVQKVQQARGKADDDKQKQSGRRDSAATALRARRGIDANAATHEQLGQRMANHDDRRARNKRDAESRHNAETARQAPEHRRASRDEPRLAVSGHAGEGGERQSGREQNGRQHHTAQDAQNPQANFMATAGAVLAIDGMGARASAHTAGAPQSLTAKELIDELVARVQQGVQMQAGQPDKNVIRLELHDNVLAGAVLTLRHEHGSDHIFLAIQTGDEEVERLLAPHTRAGLDLNKALEERTDGKLKRISIEVNGVATFGS